MGSWAPGRLAPPGAAVPGLTLLRQGGSPGAGAGRAPGEHARCCALGPWGAGRCWSDLAFAKGEASGWDPLWEPRPRAGGAVPPLHRGAPGEAASGAGRGWGGHRSWDPPEQHLGSLPPRLAAAGSGTTLCDTVLLTLVEKATTLCAAGLKWGRGCCHFQDFPGWGGLHLPPLPCLRAELRTPHLPGGTPGVAGHILDSGERPGDRGSEEAGLVVPRNGLLSSCPTTSFAFALGPPLLPRDPCD